MSASALRVQALARLYFCRGERAEEVLLVVVVPEEAYAGMSLAGARESFRVRKVARRFSGGGSVGGSAGGEVASSAARSPDESNRVIDERRGASGAASSSMAENWAGGAKRGARWLLCTLLAANPQQVRCEAALLAAL